MDFAITESTFIQFFVIKNGIVQYAVFKPDHKAKVFGVREIHAQQLAVFKFNRIHFAVGKNRIAEITVAKNAIGKLSS